MTELAHELPFWEFESAPIPHLILWDGSLSSTLEILPLDIECFDEGRINLLTLGLRSFISSLPDGMTAQFFVKVETDFEGIIDKHRELLNTDIQFLRSLDESRVELTKSLIQNGLVFRPRLFLTLKTEAATPPKTFSFGAAKKFSVEFSKTYEDRLQSLSQGITGGATALSGLGFETSALGKDETIELVYQYLNPNRKLLAGPPEIGPKIAIDGGSPREQIVFGDLVLAQENFLLDSKLTRILTLKTLPEVTFAGMMSKFLSLSFKYELLVTFHIPDQAKEIKSLEQKRRMAHALAHSASARVSDLESESRLTQTTDLIREIIETGQKIFHVQLMIVLRAENSGEGKRRLNLQTKEVLSKFKNLSGAEGIQETVGAWKIFKSDLPLAPMSLIRSKRMKTNNLVDFLPLYGARSGDDVPVVLTNTRLGSLYSLNPHDSKLTNYNWLVTGSSGSGKSFANNFLMLQQIARGTKVFIIDIGGSYKKMTEALGGQYFEINLSDQYAINPFALHDPKASPSGERIKSLVNILEQMVVDEGEKLVRLDRVQIEEVLTKVFESARTSATPRSPQLSDFARYCADSKDVNLKRIAKLMFPWVGTSPYGKLLDRAGTFNADSPIVAFDLKGLSQYPDLQSVMILILTNFILGEIELDRATPKRVLLDEAWELLKSPAASSFMEYAARTFRKTGSGITFITQGVEEIIASGIGPAILNNTATKLIMLQRGDIAVLRDALKLNSQELKLIQSLEQRKGVFSEGFLMTGEIRQVIRIQPSPLEYWISTSDARDNLYLSELRKDGLSLESALLKASELAPFGVLSMKGGSI
jgi:conjugal transfer ATP-binding protein TraC